MITFGNRVLTTTQDYHLAKVVDTILRGNVFATKMLLRAKPWRGDKIKKTVDVDSSTQAVQFSGLDTFPTAQIDPWQVMQFGPSEAGYPITLAFDELTVNAGEEQVIDLLAATTERAAMKLTDHIGNQFFGDGSVTKDFQGLGNIVDDGTTAGTIGGLSRTTNPSLKSTVTASGGTLSLAKMATVYDNCTYGTEKPTDIIVPKTVFSWYEQLLTPQEIIMKDYYDFNGKKAKGGTGFGYDALTYRGTPIMVDEKATSGVMFMINQNYIEFYAKQMYGTNPIKYGSEYENSMYSNIKGYGFSWTGWKPISNALGQTAQVVLFGQLVGWNSNRHGKLTGITGV